MSSRWAVASALLLLLAVLVLGGLYVVHEVDGMRADSARVLDAVAEVHALETARPRAPRTISMDWTDRDGQPCHVSVQSDPGEEPAHLVLRFEADRIAMEQIHPRGTR